MKNFTREKAIELFNEFLELIEFGLMYTKEKDEFGRDLFWLYDFQGANLGNISEERFSTIEEVLDRMTIYETDYIVNDLCESIERELNISVDYDYWEDLLVYRDKMNSYKWDFDILDLICNSSEYANIPLTECIYNEEE